jgi:hypothetical protein
LLFFTSPCIIISDSSSSKSIYLPLNFTSNRSFLKEERKKKKFSFPGKQCGKRRIILPYEIFFKRQGKPGFPICHTVHSPEKERCISLPVKENLLK